MDLQSITSQAGGMTVHSRLVGSTFRGDQARALRCTAVLAPISPRVCADTASARVQSRARAL